MLQPCVVTLELVFSWELIEVECQALIGFVIIVLLRPLMLDVLEDIDAGGQELDNFD